MNYKLITPIGVCKISSKAPFAAMMTAHLLCAGIAGLKDEGNNFVLKPFESIEDTMGISSEEVENLTREHQLEIYYCLRSYENPADPVDVGINIEATAKTLADGLEETLRRDGILPNTSFGTITS